MSAGFSLRAHPAFFRYLLGQGASVAGSLMRELTIAWLVLELTGSPTWLAAVSLARLGAMLALLLPAGTLVDRLPRRRVILVAESGSLLVSLALAGLSAVGVLSPWLLLLAALLLGALHAFEAPARSVLVHDLVPSEHLLPALSLMSAAQGAARIVGPALGGLLLSRIGAASCFIVDAMSYAVLLGVVLSLPGKDVAAGEESRGSTLCAALRQLGAKPAPRLTLFLFVIVGFLAAGYLPMMPAIARDLLELGADGFGVLQSVAAVGALLAGTALGMRGRGGGETRVLRGAALALPVALAGFGLAGSPWLAAVAVLLAAGSLTAANASANAALQLAVPETMRARAVSLHTIVAHAHPVGGWLLAFGAGLWGLRASLLALAALCALLVLAAPVVSRSLDATFDR